MHVHLKHTWSLMINGAFSGARLAHNARSVLSVSPRAARLAQRDARKGCIPSLATALMFQSASVCCEALFRSAGSELQLAVARQQRSRNGLPSATSRCQTCQYADVSKELV